MSMPTLSLTIAGLHRVFGADHRVIVEVAQRAEAAGFDQVVLPDHVVMSANVEPYPYGDFPFPPGDPWVEPLTTLAAIAGATSTVRLGTGVLITPRLAISTGLVTLTTSADLPAADSAASAFSPSWMQRLHPEPRISIFIAASFQTNR